MITKRNIIKKRLRKRRINKMDDWDFDLFREDLKVAVKKVHNDKCSRVETFVDMEDKEYKVIIEETKSNKEKIK